jgi:hypothetical protein
MIEGSHIMKVDKRVRVLSVLLVLSGIALSSLVPGGPIENRDFSHIAPVVLLVFNIFLTALGLGSFLLVAGLMRGVRQAWPLTFWAAASYLLVYAIDLLGVFPQSPTAMGNTLLVVEVLGVALALPMLWLTAHAEVTSDSRGMPMVGLGPGSLILIITLAVAIVFVATTNAMGW